MGLIHDAEYNFGIACIVCRKLGPQAHKLGIRRATLPDDATVPASICSWSVILYKLGMDSYSCGYR